ncbi:MAG TPA: sugar transferase [Mucilaginibacter sp.]|jgi:lipopolysaccharide/colanic/teichoic acid biosynthesis glycosyltransferase|nr:sugar transferase [Mucilaginibacter sp.]
MYKFLFKRLIDLIVAIIGLTLLSPVLIVIIVILFFSNSGKVFFVQRRPGLHGNIFRIIKFKTMNDETGPDGQLLPDAERLTPIGRFVRKTSLDEVPQLLNVIRGTMSLVGPRPLLIEYLPLYSAEQSRRHDVKPGITGWAQVNGRNAITWEQKFNYDVWYVDHQSFSVDMKIIGMTMFKTVKSEGISQEGHVTMHKFEGNKI